MKPTIKEGDAQPIDCPKCKGKMGYAFTDYLKANYTTHITPEGIFDYGEYSEIRPIIKSEKAVCVKCNTELPFRIERD